MRVVTTLAILTGAASAYADDSTTSEALFLQAKQLVSAGDYAHACPLFEQSLKLDPSALGAELNLADCYVHVGRIASAWTAYHDVADRAERAHDSRAQYARDHADALEPRLARMQITLPPNPPPGLVIRRDGTDITAIIGVATPVDPGPHIIEATAPGFTAEALNAVVDGEGNVVSIAVPALVAAPAPGPAPMPPSATPAFPAPALVVTKPEESVQERAARLARLHSHFRLFFGGGFNVGAAPGTQGNPGVGSSTGPQIYVGLRRGIGSRFEIEGNVQYGFLQSNDDPANMVNGENVSQELDVLALELTARVRPARDTPIYIGLGGRAAEVIANAYLGSSTNTGTALANRDFFVPAGVVELGALFGKNEQWEVSLRFSAGSGLSSVVMQHAGDEWLGMGTLQVDYTFGLLLF